jgi:hypothetical protein
MYDDLKEKVLQKVGVAPILPRHCKLISRDIYEITHVHISETTLKRFFGFAEKNYKFSSSTLSVLNVYVNHVCHVNMTIKIDSPTADSEYDKTQYHLLDGTIQFINCKTGQELHNLGTILIPVKIKLNRIQVQEIKNSISKTIQKLNLVRPGSS